MRRVPFRIAAAPVNPCQLVPLGAHKGNVGAKQALLATIEPGGWMDWQVATYADAAGIRGAAYKFAYRHNLIAHCHRVRANVVRVYMIARDV